MMYLDVDGMDGKLGSLGTSLGSHSCGCGTLSVGADTGAAERRRMHVDLRI